MRLFTCCGFVFLIFCSSIRVGAQQCLVSGFCSGGVQYPSGTFSSNTNSWTTVSTLNYAGEYGVYNVTSGSQYEWSLCASDGGSASYDAQLTLINNTTLANICYSDNQCASNTPKIQWTATFTGTVRVLINQFNCITNSTFTTIVWRCSSCGSGSAPANDNCSGATALTIYSGSSCGGATTGNVTGATQSVAAEVCDGFTGTANDDVWYKFTTGAGGGNHTITVAGSASFDAVVDLRSGACNGTNVSCADASGSGGTEIINAVLSGSTTYYVRVYDYYSGTPATTTFTICITTPSSCTPYYSTGTSAGDYINRVQLNTIDNTPAGTGSTSGSYYNDYYSTVSTTLQAGTSHTLTVTVGTYGGQTIAAWIDYNQDGDFLDASENLGEVTNIAASASGIINFTLPAGATSGNTHMRVRTVWSDIGIDPCATYSYGEAEDYKINITSACTTPGTPVSLSTSGISTSGATLNWAAGTPAGSATVTYYWALGSASNVTYEANYLQRGTTTSLNSGALSGLSPGITYYWTVKAVTSCDGTVSSYAVAISFTTSCTTPSAPTALNTTNISTTSATLNWTASASGSPTINYYWAVGSASNVTYEANYLQRGIATSVSVNVFTLTANTTYYWTVKAVTSCNGSASSYPSAISFTTTTIPTPLIVWNGNTSTDWNTSTNWTPNQIPTVSDNVQIPAGRPNYPLIAAGGLSINNSVRANRCKSLTIDANASMTITSTLSVDIQGTFDLFGTFNHQPGSSSNIFQINAGGNVTVKNGAYLNIGSTQISGGVPGGTINGSNDLQISGGQLLVDPGGTLYIQDALKITSGTFYQKNGLVSVALNGVGDASDKVSLSSGATFKLSAGTFRVSGDADGTTTSWDAIWFGAGSTVDIQGGTIELLNGTTASDFTLTFAQATTLNSLVVNKTGKSALLDGYDVSVNGDVTITAGTFNANGKNITAAGNWTNNASATAFTAGTGTVTFTGSSKTIGGSFGTNFNTLTVNAGASYTINPSGGSWPNNVAQAQGAFTNSGDITIASGKALDLYGAANTLNGTITAASNYDGTRDIDLNTTGNFSSNGTINADLRIFSGTSALTSDFTLNGNFTIRSGAGFTMTTHTFTENGSWTNDGTFTSGSGSVVFSGSSKSITGASAGGATSAFNNFIIQAGASYTFNPTASNWDVNGSFLNSGTLNISSDKFIDVYSATSESESVVLDGTITAATVNDGTQDIDINNTVNLSGSGDITADIRIFSNTTTLTSDFTLNGGFEIRSGSSFTMSTHNLLVESWKNSGTFTAGTGTVKFIGSGSRTVDASCNYSGAAKATADFYNVIVDRGTDTVFMYNTPMRVANDFTVENGIFSTGWRTNSNGNDGHNRRLTVEKIATIKSGGTFFIGYQRACGAAGENLPCGTSDSLNVPVFKGDIINYGLIKTNRPLSSGFSDLKLTGARITGEGDANEFGVDIQPEDNTTVTQVGHVDIQGDLIIQDPAANLWENTDPDNILTVRGNFYLYGSFTHNGTINLYGNMTSASNVSNTVTMNSSIFNFYQSATKYIYLDKNPVSFGQFNVKTGTNTREIRQNINVANDLTIESGSTLDAYTSNSNITLSGTTSSWTNNGTFTPQSGTVSFTGSSAQNMGGASATTFHNLTIANTSSTGVTFNNSGTVTNTLTLTDGILYTTSSKLLTINDQGTVSPAGGVAGSYVSGPMKKIGRDGAAGPYGFLFPTGKNNTWARLYMVHFSGTTATTDAFTAEYFDNGYGVYTMGSPLLGVSSLEYWNLTKNSGDAGLNKRVRLYSENNSLSQIDAYNHADLTVAHWNSGTSQWEDIGFNPNSSNSGAGTPSGWISSDYTASFSPFTFASRSSANPLPVELLTFDAKLNGDKVDLFWITAAEINNDYFTVERSRDMENFEKIITVKGAGNSNVPVDYSAIDDHPVEGTSFYRLKQTDFDGTITYSDAVPVTLSRTKVHTDTISALKNMLVYPNPGKGLFNINFENNAEGIYQFMVFDITGRRVHLSQKALEKGSVLIPVDLSELTSGTYILVVQASGNRFSHKLIIHK